MTKDAEPMQKHKLSGVDKSLADILPKGVIMSAKDGVVSIQLDPMSSPDKLRSLGGSKRIAANVALANEVLAMLPVTNDLWIMGTRAAGALELLQELKPTDGVEGMLAVQTVALHMMGMLAGSRAHASGQPSDAAARLRKDAVNAMRGMTDMLAALDRKRGKGGQHIRVEKVLVTEGGALIGNSGTPAIGQSGAPMALPGGGVERELETIEGPRASSKGD